MKLLNIPACNCQSPFGQVIAFTDAGTTYCATCRQESNDDKPHFADVPLEIKPVVEAITSIAHLHIWQLRPSVASQFFSDIVDVTILKARSRDFAGDCQMQWGKQSFPLPSRINQNQPRGKRIDLHKLPVTVTPEIQKFLKLLQEVGFLVTQIVPSNDNTMRMYLECWFGPKDTASEHQKLIVRIELAFSMDIAHGIRAVLNALNSYKAGQSTPLPYADDLRVPLEASAELNFALPSTCQALLQRPYRHAVFGLASAEPQYADDLVKMFPDLSLMIWGFSQDALQNPARPRLNCSERDALFLVAQYAQYHLQTIEERIKAVLHATEHESSLPHPKRIEELRLDSGTRELAKPHFDFIDAVYALFLRIPMQVIKMEGSAAFL